MTAYLKILLGIAAGPGLLFILPLVLSSTNYGRVFGFIAVVQIISLFSTLGLEIVAARTNFPNRYVFVMVAVTTSLITLVYRQIQGALESFDYIILAFLVAYANNMYLIMQNQYLFRGDSGGYAKLGVFRASFLIVLFFVSVQSSVSIEIGWTFASIASFMGGFLVVKLTKSKSEMVDKNNITLVDAGKIYYASLPMAILNSLSGLPFVAERLIAKEFFQPEIFVKYAICATTLLPVVYMGNMVQNHLISQVRLIDSAAAIRAVRLISLLICVYAFVLVAFIPYIYPEYFKSRIEYVIFAGPFAFWMFIYCILIFPLAAIMQKQGQARVLFSCAVASLILVGVFYSCFTIFVVNRSGLDFPWMAAVAAGTYAIGIVVIRGIYIWPLARINDSK